MCFFKWECTDVVTCIAMSVSNSETKLFLPKAPTDQELLRLKRLVKDLEEDAIKKDQLLSQLMSRMREYEMGEYGLTEAVNEIKECKKVIRARDREIEKLTDEINLLKLHMSVNLEVKETSAVPSPISYDQSAILEAKEDSELHKEQIKEKHSPELLEKHESCQCSIPIYPLKCNEALYSSKVQNEKLRSELLEVCRNAIESVSYFQKDYKKCELKNENIIKRLKDHLLKLEGDEHIKNEEFMSKNISTNEQKCKKTKKKQENISQILTPVDLQFILQLAKNWDFCKESPCNNSMMKLMELEMKLLNEILLLKKLLEIAHHQTQELEAINFSQEIQMKALKNHLSLFQGKNDERKLLSKLAMKVLQLQFNQAAYLFELKKIKN